MAVYELLRDPMKLAYTGRTDVGRKRTHNEDNYLLLPEQSLFVVCDGMGGHASGEVASQIAVDTIAEFFEATQKDADKTWPFRENKSYDYDSNRLITAIRLANKRVIEQSAGDPKQKGMGTTCVGTLFREGQVLVAHVGDSRCYRIRGGEITQITEDHSLLNDYKKMHQMTDEEEATFPHKNIIVRALGMKEDVTVDLNVYETQVGDIYLTCSDGLNGEITDAEMLEIVTAYRDDLDTAAAKLIQLANEHGGKDNVTVTLVRVDE